jgi:cytochrome c oxidase assembly factor CtaG
MRATSLIAVAAVVFFSYLAFAEQNAKPATAPVLNAEWLQTPAAPSVDNAGIIKFSAPDTPDSDTTCFMMRTWYVARVHPKSDETRVVGYSTCQLSSRYDVKRAHGEHDDHAKTPAK